MMSQPPFRPRMWSFFPVKDTVLRLGALCDRNILIMLMHDRIIITEGRCSFTYYCCKIVIHHLRYQKMRHAIIIPIKFSCKRLIVVAILFSGGFWQPIRQERGCGCGQTERWTGECAGVAKVEKRAHFIATVRKNGWAGSKETKTTPWRREEVAKQ